MALPNEPITRQEMYLSNIAGQNTALPDAPITREEMYLDYIAKTGGTGEGDMKKSIYDSDNSVATAGGIKMFVNQKIGTLPQRVGSLETTAGVLQGEVVSIENTLGGLGTASTKNSTSVVTQSTDLVESGAVKDIVGWGNKNLLSRPYYLASGSSDNATWIMNDDGSVTVSTSAPLTAQVNIQLRYGDIPDELLNIPLLLSGCPSGGSSTTYEIGAFHYDGINTARDYGDTDGVPLTFTANGDKLISITLRSGINIPTPITFYPMLRKASVSDPTYEPYHASVEESKADNSVIGTVEDGTTASQAYAVGSHFIRNGAFCTVTQAISSGGTLTEGTNYTSGDVAELIPIRKRFRVELSDITWSAGGDTYYGIVYEGASGTKILSVSLCDWSFQVNMLKIMPVIRGNDKDIIIISEKNTYNPSDFVDVVITYI